MATKNVSTADLNMATMWLKQSGIGDPKAGMKVLDALIKMGAASGTVEIGMGNTKLTLDTERIAILRRVRTTLKAMDQEKSR